MPPGKPLKPEERRALAKCRVAECFKQDGTAPKLTDELANAAAGSVRRSVYLALMQRGLIKMDHGFRLTALGLHLLDLE